MKGRIRKEGCGCYRWNERKKREKRILTVVHYENAA